METHTAMLLGKFERKAAQLFNAIHRGLRIKGIHSLKNIESLECYDELIEKNFERLGGFEPSTWCNPVEMSEVLSVIYAKEISDSVNPNYIETDASALISYLLEERVLKFAKVSSWIESRYPVDN